MNNTGKVLIVDINDYRFIHREEAKKDIEVYKKSTVKPGEYIFVQTIRLYTFESKYMISEENLKICCEEWYQRFIEEN